MNLGKNINNPVMENVFGYEISFLGSIDNFCFVIYVIFGVKLRLRLHVFVTIFCGTLAGKATKS